MLDYVSSVESNVKKRFSTKLSPKTLLVGANGSGKSAVLNAIELAIHGFCSDFNGRGTVASKDYLANFGDSLWARLSIAAQDHDFTITYPAQSVTASRLQHEAYKDAFPLIELKDAISGSAIVTWEYLLRKFGILGFGQLQALRDSVATCAKASARLTTVKDYMAEYAMRAESHWTSAILEELKHKCTLAEVALSNNKHILEGYEERLTNYLLNNPFTDTIAKAMSKYVPAWCPNIKLDYIDDKGKLKFGFSGALSGGEYAVATTALALACVDAGPVKGNISIVFSDDRQA